MKQTSHSAFAIITAKLAFGASLALGLALSPHGAAHATPATQDSITFADLEPADGEDVYGRESILEDDPRWDCRTMGNRICGPGATQGVPAGCYNDTGTMVAPWPCHVRVNEAGEGDVYTGPDPTHS